MQKVLEMAEVKLQSIRNIGFIAHIDAGKTTTTERILFYTGRTHKLGEVDEGTTITDWMPQEKERGITITSAATYCRWKNYHINIIDTPGHVDFTVEVERSLKVLDGCVVILCAQGGVEPQSETVWRQAESYGVPRIVFVNKMDKVGADLFRCVEEIREKLKVEPLLLQLPIYEEGEFVGIVDLLKEKAVLYKDRLGTELVYKEPDDALQSEIKKYREALIEKVAEKDDTVMQRYIESEPLTEAKLIDSIRKLTIQRKLVPVFCGSALRNKGIQLLLDGICRYLPSPLDIKVVKGYDFQQRPVQRVMGVEEDFCALCFKVSIDPYVGKLNYVRVYSGVVKAGESIYNSTQGLTQRVNKIVRMHAYRQENIEVARCGDIVSLVGLKETVTGDTLCTQDNPIVLEKMHFPEPVISQAIEPKSKSEEEKLSYALARISEEDPTFRVEYNKEVGQIIISGMGQLHLEIITDRIRREFGIQTHVGRPQVAFRETLTRRVTSVGKFIQQTGGRGQYAHVVLVLEPREEPGVSFQSKIKGGVIPQEFIPAVKKGIEENSRSGILGGFPLTNIKVILIDGSFHEVDSSDLAFQMAAGIALKEGLKKAECRLLEPIMKLEIFVPGEYLSQVIGDLNSKRARIAEIGDKAGVKSVKSFVALRELFDYADVLRNITQGRASYTMEPAFYDTVPEDIVQKVLF